MKRHATITAIILVTLIFPATILAWQNTLEVSSEKSIAIAIDFLKNSPTFNFDGVIESIKVQKVSELEKYPVLYVIEIDFSCKHGGYGDRSGEYLVQVISPHSIIIYIENNHVIKAVIDDVWDEVNQSLLFTQKEAEITALSFLLGCTTFKFDGITSSVKFVKSETFFTLFTWEITYNFQCEHPGYGRYKLLTEKTTTHTIKIVVKEGKLIQATVDDTWDELNEKYISTDVPKNDPITSETVINVAVKYFINKYQLNEKIPDEWEIKNLTPDKLLGYQTLQYTSRIWKITIKNPVIQYPIYDLTIEYFNVKEIKLSLSVDQQANIIEK